MTRTTDEILDDLRARRPADAAERARPVETGEAIVYLADVIAAALELASTGALE